MQVIALIGEFASRWLINVFDVTFSVYGEEHFGVSSSLYSYTTAVGSMVNIFQTGWLFNRLLRWDVSIPLITSMTGVCGAIGIFTCLFAPNKAVAILGSVFFIFAYGCAAPTAPTVMSVRSLIAHTHGQTESPAHLQGVGTASVLIGGQSAYILAPNILSSLYAADYRLPFYCSLVPCAAVFISMLILHFIPGGRTAGQVPLKFALESMVKNQKMEGVDNEHEEEVIARGGEKKEREKGEDDKKGGENDHDVMIEMVCMESKEKGAENGDERWMMEDDHGVDMDAFVVPPRFNSGGAASLHSSSIHTPSVHMSSIHAIRNDVHESQETEEVPPDSHFSEADSDEDLAI